MAFRKTFHESLDQQQTDLDRYLEFYHRERAQQGYRTQGHIRYQALREEVKMPKRPPPELKSLPPEYRGVR